MLEADANLTAGSPVEPIIPPLKRHDMLLIRGKEYQEKKQQKIEEKEAQEKKGLTFRPKIMKKKAQNMLKASSSADTLNSRNLADINKLLKERAKATITDDDEFIPAEGGTGGTSMPRKEINKEKKPRLEELAAPKVKQENNLLDLDYERQKKDCKFRPKISKF